MRGARGSERGPAGRNGPPIMRPFTRRHTRPIASAKTPYLNRIWAHPSLSLLSPKRWPLTRDGGRSVGANPGWKPRGREGMRDWAKHCLLFKIPLTSWRFSYFWARDIPEWQDPPIPTSWRRLCPSRTTFRRPDTVGIPACAGLFDATTVAGVTWQSPPPPPPPLPPPPPAAARCATGGSAVRGVIFVPRLWCGAPRTALYQPDG